jgi:MFS superfamily sulfate permease-like transporter
MGNARTERRQSQRLTKKKRTSPSLAEYIIAAFGIITQVWPMNWYITLLGVLTLAVIIVHFIWSHLPWQHLEHSKWVKSYIIWGKTIVSVLALCVFGRVAAIPAVQDRWTKDHSKEQQATSIQNKLPCSKLQGIKNQKAVTV